MEQRSAEATHAVRPTVYKTTSTERYHSVALPDVVSNAYDIGEAFALETAKKKNRR
jgi:hypothetical protein